MATVDAIVATAEANEINPKSVGPKNLATIIMPKYAKNMPIPVPMKPF